MCIDQSLGVSFILINFDVVPSLFEACNVDIIILESDIDARDVKYTGLLIKGRKHIDANFAVH